MTISFGLRNVDDPAAALREFLRVTRPGGRLVVCEFSQPTWPPFRTVYVEYLMRALPPVARRVARATPTSYVYLAESIRAWPDQRGLARTVEGAGWTRRRVAQPHRRHRRAAPRHQARRLTALVTSGMSVAATANLSDAPEGSVATSGMSVAATADFPDATGWRQDLGQPQLRSRQRGHRLARSS